MKLYGMTGTDGRTLSHTLLQAVADLEWGLPQLPELAKGEQGKPYFPQYPQYQFNLSHSGGVALCGVDSAPLGVDVQKFRPPTERFLPQLCSEAERDWLCQRGNSPQAFAQLWALKESRCKQSGAGITRPISGISIPLFPDATVMWQSASWEGLTFSIFQIDGAQVAVCGTSAPVEPIVWL